MRKKALAALLALSMVIPNGLGANIASAASSSTTITVNSMDDTTTNVSEVISGKVSSSKTITNVNYKATSENGEVYAENAATVNGKKWSVDDLLLRPGENTVTITVKTSDGKKTTTSVNVNYDSGSFEDITEVATTAEGNKFAAEQLVVMFKGETTEERRQEIIEKVGGEQIGVLYAIDEYQVKFDGADAAALEKYITKFEAYDEVIVANYNYVNEVSTLPNDPWGGDDEWTESSPEGYNWGMEAIHAESAWQYQDKLSLTSDNKAAIKVGISDAGFDMDHEDLDLTSITSSTSEHYHGTHVAGTIGGIGNNGTGVTGVLWNADTIVKASMGIQHVVELIQNGAKVVNCSWGLVYPSASAGKSGGIQAANAMAKLLEQGYDFLVVQSSGNDTLDSTWNGSFAGITEETTLDDEYDVTIEEIMNHKVIVGAVNNLGSNTYQTASFSNYGKYVDVVAPGVSIYSAKLNNTYGLLNGTSMAAPHVTGCLAYLWSLNPTLSAAEVKDIMLSNTSIEVKDYSAAKSGIDSYPMVDLYLASKAIVGGGDEGTAVYFDNSVANWSSVYAYVWSDGVEATVLPTTLVDSTNKIYKVTVPYNYKKIIFKNTKDSWDIQTGDLFVPTDSNNCWKPNSSSNRASGSWYAYSGGGVVTPTPSTDTVFYYNNEKTNWSNVYAYVWADGVSATTYAGTKVATNVYQFKVPKQYTKVLFKNTSGTSSWDQQTANAGEPEEGKVFIPSSSSNKTSGTWENYEVITPVPVTTAPVTTAPVTTAPVTTAPVTTPPVNEMSFNYDNSKTNWSSVYVYAWVEGDSSVDPIIVKSIACVNNVYSFKVADTYKNILFKNVNSTSVWDQQTADTTLPTAYGYTFITDSGSNKTGGYWTKVTAVPVTTAPVTTAPVTTAPVTTAPVENTMLYYNNSKTSWSNVYAYVWADGVSAKVYESTKVATDVYQFSVPKKYTKILFKNTSGTSNWDKQTDDVLIQSTDGYIFVPNSSSNKTSGKWETYVVVTPTPTLPCSTQPASPTPTPISQSYVTVDFDNSLHEWENVYAYVWNSTDDYKVFSVSMISGDHVLFNITGSYKYILFKNTEDGWDKQTADLVMPAYTTSVDDKCFTPSSAANKATGTWGKSSALTDRKIDLPSILADKDTVAVGDTVNFTMTAQYESGNYHNARYLTFTYEDGTKDILYSYDTSSIFEKESGYTYKYSWKPSKTGKVKVTYSVSEYQDHVETSQPITLNVKAASNTVKVYYKNSSWSKAYVHYKVNGSWTSVPGVKMESSDRSGYTWMYTIDLGDTTSATLCFNNGSGSWDSKNGSNYTVGTGAYGVSSGNVVNLN